jgi:hypothetical protein
MCPHTAAPFMLGFVSTYRYVSSCYYICVLVLPYMCPRTIIYVSSYCYMCVLILLYVCPHSSMCVLIMLCVSSYCYICVLILLCVSSYCYICFLILLCVFSYYYTSLIPLAYSSKRTHYSMRTHILLYICPHTPIYVSTYCCYYIAGCIYLCSSSMRTHTLLRKMPLAVHLATVYVSSLHRWMHLPV